MEYYSTFKKKKILSFVISRMNPEDSMLSERSWTWKDKCCMISLICEIQNSQTPRSREYVCFQELGRKENWEMLGKEYEVQVTQDV